MPEQHAQPAIVARDGESNGGRSDVEQLTLILEASTTLLESLRLDDILPRVLDLASRTLAADAYGLWRLDSETGVWSIASVSGVSDEYARAATEAIQGNVASVSLDAPLAVEDISATEWLTAAHREAHAAEGNRAMLAVPLRDGATILGTLVFYFRAPHVFTPAELDAVTTLANLAASAIRTAALYEAQLGLTEAGRFLADAGELLSSSLDYEDTLANLAQLAVPRFADWCTIDMLDEEGRIRRLAVAHADPEKVRWADELAATFPEPDPESPYGVPKVIRTGKPELVPEIPDELLVEALADTPELLPVVRELGLRSSMTVPLVARGRPLGAMSFFSAESDHRYDERDLGLALELARRASVAVDNALLYRREQAARAAAEAAQRRLEFLAEASQLLASSLDYEQTLTNVAALVVPEFADWCAVDYVGEDGELRRLAVAHRDPDKAEWAERSRVDFGSYPNEPEGTGRVVRTGKSVLYREIDDELLVSSTQSPEHLQTLRELGMASAMVVPLPARGRTLGTLMLVSSDPERLYGEEDVMLAEHVGRRCATAVDNALLYRRVEEAVRAAEERAHASLALAYVGDGVFLVDREGIVRLWNPAAAAITGVAEADVVGKRAEEAVEGWEAFLEVRAHESGETASAGRPETVPVDIGGRELWLSIAPVAFPEGVVFAFRDLTDEQALDRMKADFISTVSHELRTPLAAIYGAALTLRRSDVVLEAEQQQGLLGIVADEAERLARIVNDILWASRVESGSLHVTIATVDAEEIARGVIESARLHLPENVQLACSAEGGLPPISADADKVRQVLANLVDNAVKYSPDGGAVEVLTAAVEERVRYVVRDEGLGIPPAEHRRIFEKFYRLDPNLTRGVGGTGLGLYVCRELARMMGGRIWVESTGERGSSFFFELPADRRGAAEAAPR